MHGSGLMDGWARNIVDFSANLLCLVRDGEITFVNPGGVRMLGQSFVTNIIGHRLSDFVQSDYKDLVEEGLEMLASEGMPLPLKLVRKDGSLVDAELTASLAGKADNADFLIEARDITKFIRAAEDTRDREARLQGILSTLADAVITVDEQGIMQTVNPAAEDIFGYRAFEMMGKNINLLIPEPHKDSHDAYMKRYIVTGKSEVVGTTREVQTVRKDGSIFFADLTVTEMRKGKHWLFIAVVRDISERKEIEARIRHMAHHDSLTGLPNRNLLDDRLEQAVERAQRSKEQMGLMYLDLDKFKPINDTLGHQAGDKVLKTVARRLQSCLRKTDTVARVGGDEFVIILENPGGAIDADVVSRKILAAVPEPIDYDGQNCAVGCSIGIAVFPDDANTLDGISRCADEAMYGVKEAGRNNFLFYKDLPGKS